jgi:hypothetical protein
MEALVTCRCTHSILVHEDGGCATPRCRCERTRYSVLDDEIDRLRVEHRPGAAPGKAGGFVQAGP